MRPGEVARRISASVAALVAISACAPAAAPGALPAAPPGAAPAPAPLEAPRRGGIFAYAGQSIGQTLHPHTRGAVSERYVPGPLYETLLVYKYDIGGDFRIDFDVSPWLAERWETPNDTTYRLQVRQGVRWHDGAEFTAEDVAYTYRELLDPKNNYPMRSRLQGVTSITASDKYTLQIVTDGPTPNLLADLADPNMMIMAKHVGDRGDDFAKVAIGTGPVKLKSYERDKGGSFVRYPDYWQKDKPAVDGLEVHLVPDVAGRQAAFLAKAVDLRAPADRRQLDEILTRFPTVQYASIMTDYGNSLLPKLDQPPFNDRRVRRAMHLAVDRQGLVKVASFGEGVISPPGMPGQKQGWSIPQEELLRLPGYRQPKDQDLAEAKRLLAEAGYPDGLKTTVMWGNTYASSPKIIEPLAGQLRAAGIELVLDGRPQADLRKIHLEGKFDVIFELAANMAVKYQRDYIHSKGPLNKFALNDPRIDQAIDTIFRSLDLSKRKTAALELQRVLLEENYVIPTIELPGYQAWHPWLKNYRYNVGISEIIDARPMADLWLDVDQMPADRRKGQ